MNTTLTPNYTIRTGRRLVHVEYTEGWPMSFSYITSAIDWVYQRMCDHHHTTVWVLYWKKADCLRVVRADVHVDSGNEIMRGTRQEIYHALKAHLQVMST